MRNSLRKLEGIQSVDVDLEFGEAIVRYKADVVDFNAMIKATTDIGFPSAVRSSEAQKVENTAKGSE